jgi:hypothetical protein
MGSRPGSSDFAVYGQLTQLAQFDPTPMAQAVRYAPRVCAQVDRALAGTGCETLFVTP